MKREMDTLDYVIAAAWAFALVPLIIFLVDRLAPYLPLRWR